MIYTFINIIFVLFFYQRLLCGYFLQTLIVKSETCKYETLPALLLHQHPFTLSAALNVSFKAPQITALCLL